MRKITDAVAVHRDEKGATIVSISVDPGEEGTEAAEAILAKAWGLLAEAISAQKLAAETDHQETDPGGAGGWWSG